MRKCVYKITIDGNDITSKVSPRLIKLTHSDKEGAASDTVDIELDDTDGELLFPRDGVGIEVSYGWDTDGPPPVRFRGTVDEPHSRGGRGEGRTMTISAKGIDTKSKQKEEALKSWDGKTLGDVLKEAGKAAGITEVKVDPQLAKIKRPYWAQNDESFISFGQRLAEEVGGTFKIQGKKATVTKRGAGKNTAGAELPTISAAWGENLISWDITPTAGRPRYNRVKVRIYDKKKGKWRDKRVDVAGEGTDVQKTSRRTAADDDEAESLGKAEAGESERGKGGGSIRIDGTGAATPEGKVALLGARPGVDGTYTITDVSQEISGGTSGWETELTVKKPEGEAGKDSRGKPKKAAAEKDGATGGSGAAGGSGGGATPATGTTGRNNDAGIGGGGAVG